MDLAKGKDGSPSLPSLNLEDALFDPRNLTYKGRCEFGTIKEEGTCSFSEKSNTEHTCRFRSGRSTETLLGVTGFASGLFWLFWLEDDVYVGRDVNFVAGSAIMPAQY